LNQPTGNTSGYEVITDLGNITSLITAVQSAGSGGDVVGNGVDAFTNNFTGLNGSGACGAASGMSSAANLQVAYFAINNGTSTAYVSGSRVLTSNSSFAGQLNTIPSNFLFTANQNVQSGTSTAVLAESNVYSFNSSVEQGGGGGYGNYLNFIKKPAGQSSFNAFNTESNLGGLYGSANPLTLYSLNMAASQAGTALFTITTNADGSTTLTETQTTTPVPPGILLLAPGLLGLVGIRRRMA
jgi:hypothetical protein